MHNGGTMRVGGAMAEPEVTQLSPRQQESVLRQAFMAAEEAGEAMRLARGRTAWTDEEIDAAGAVLRHYLLGDGMPEEIDVATAVLRYGLRSA
jgi:hypothetical protein